MDKKELFDNFQNNWMRLLSPFEIEDINKWIDTVEKVEFARLQFENKKLSQGKGQLSNVPSWSNPDYRDPTYDDLKVNPSEVSDGSGDF